jgi:hypothetical protein
MPDMADKTANILVVVAIKRKRELQSEHPTKIE